MLPHALLFWGPEGTGKLASAIALAQYLLCRDKQTGGPCGECRSCLKTAKLIHPDMHFIFPTVGAKVRSTDLYPQWREALQENMYLNVQEWLLRISGDNKQGNINAADCQHILEQLMLKSFESRYKVLIMWMAEYLQKEGNKLLKMIEEPPQDTVIVLIAEDRDAILPTVLSRCQQLFFGPLSNELVTQALSEQEVVSDERSKWVAAASQGNWNLALQLAAGNYFNPVEWVQNWIRAAWSRNPAEMQNWVGAVAANTREQHKQFLRYLLNVLQKLFWLKWGIPFETETEEMKLVKFLNTKIEFNELEALVRLCEDNITAIERNANARIVWMDTTLKLRDALHQTNAGIRAGT